MHTVEILYCWWDLLHISLGRKTLSRKGLKGLSSVIIVPDGSYRCRYHFHLHQLWENPNTNMILKNSQHSGPECTLLARLGRLLEAESFAACEDVIHWQRIVGCHMGSYMNCRILQRSHTQLCQRLSWVLRNHRELRDAARLRARGLDLLK